MVYLDGFSRRDSLIINSIKDILSFYNLAYKLLILKFFKLKNKKEE